jgi:glycosyltransferase involved in cell wall biosynthesis
LRKEHVTNQYIDVDTFGNSLDATDPVEISVVMPCLNEAESVGICVRKALQGMKRSGMRGEVIVSDNGSTDGSPVIAAEAGARVVRQPLRGYGNAYLKGFSEARGRYIVMGDSDDTYDFTVLDQLVQPLANGEADYVLGSRFGGEIMKGAMSWSHRYIGNPILTGVLNVFFGLKSSDAHSGMRAFTRESLDHMALCCEGMEFASEIVVKAARAELRVAEVPIQYHPRIGESKLNGVRDAWRHMRFMLLLSPKYVFILPGLAFFVIGLVGQSALLFGSVTVGHHLLQVHFSILAALLTLAGSQAAIFGVFAQTYAKSIGLDKPGVVSDWVERDFSLERGLVVGGIFILGGLTVDIAILAQWISHSLGALDAVRPAIFALTLLVLGLQFVFAAFFLSLFKVRTHVIPDVRHSSGKLTEPQADDENQVRYVVLD